MVLAEHLLAQAHIYSLLLTRSLPGYHLKKINNGVKFELPMHFVCLFCEVISIKTLDIESDLLYDRKIYCLQVCVCAFFQPRNFYRLRQ